MSDKLALWHLASWRGGVSDVDYDLIRAEWPDIPGDSSQWLPWLAGRPDVTEAIATVKPGGPPPNGDGTLAGWRVYTLADAYAPRPPVRYVVDGLLSLPSLSVVYGPPGCFKTMLMGDLAGCVAGGLPWLQPLPGKGGHTERPTEAAAVLWLDFDNGLRVMSERLEAVGRARGLAPTVPLSYVSMPNPWLEANKWDSSVAQLADRIHSLGAKLVIVDNLRDVCGGVEENSATMGDVMSNFRRLAENTGAAVVLIHHQRKGNGMKGRAGDTLRGHSSIEAALDLALLVEREAHSDMVRIEATKVRGADVLPFGAVFSYEWRPNTTELGAVRFWGIEVEDVTSDAAIRRAILEVVAREPGITKTRLVDATRENLPEVGRDLVRLQLAALVNSGDVTRRDGDRNAIHYDLPGGGDPKDATLL